MAGALALVPLVGAGGPDPSLGIAARVEIVQRAAAADRALERLEVALEPGLSAARSGAAAVITGDQPPTAPLAAAAGALEAGSPVLDEVLDRIAALDQARIALDPSVEPVAFSVRSGELGSIGGQLEAATEAADEFVHIRLRAEGMAGRLDEALAALADGDLATADGHIRAARGDLDAIEGWDVDFVTLPVWIETADAMIGAMERIVAATRADDSAAADRAAEDFAAAAEEAASADRALRIAIGEGGSAVTAAPLERLALVLRSVAAARAEVASIVQTVAR
jgi:hypothetical protein